MREEDVAKFAYAKMIETFSDLFTNYCDHEIELPSTIKINGTTYQFSKIPNISPIYDPS